MAHRRGRRSGGGAGHRHRLAADLCEARPAHEEPRRRLRQLQRGHRLRRRRPSPGGWGAQEQGLLHRPDPGAGHRRRREHRHHAPREPVSSTMFMVVSSLQFSPAGGGFFRGFRGWGSPICRIFVRGRLPQIPVYQPRSGLSRGAEAQKTAPGAYWLRGRFFTLPSARSSGSPGAGCCGGRGRGGRCPRPSRPRGPRRRGPGRRGWVRPR